MKQPRYNNNTHKDFMPRLRKEVHLALKDKGQMLQRLTYMKALTLIVVFILLLFCFWNLTASPLGYLTSAVMLGVLCLPIVLNIGHEAVHDTFSKNKKINNAGKWVFYLLGTSSYFWELRHISSHHAFANVGDLDMDIEQSKIIRLSTHQEHEPRHKLQHWYMPLAFCFYTLVWFFVRDFKDIKNSDFGAKQIDSHPKKELVFLILAKLLHLSLFIVIPLYLGVTLGMTIAGFLAFHIAASIITTFALVSTHVGEDQEIVIPNENGELPYSWVEHQLKTTADFATSNGFLTNFFGGFNHHIAHHLFPYVSHANYPLITPLIRKYAEEYGIDYLCYNNLWETSKSHIKRLKTLSLDQDI